MKSTVPVFAPLHRNHYCLFNSEKNLEVTMNIITIPTGTGYGVFRKCSEGNTILNNGGKQLDKIYCDGSTTGELVGVTNEDCHLRFVFRDLMYGDIETMLSIAERNIRNGRVKGLSYDSVFMLAYQGIHSSIIFLNSTDLYAYQYL